MLILISLLFFSSILILNKMDKPDFDKLWDYNDPAATEIKFREILPEVEKFGDKDLIAQLHTQIARTFSLRSKFEEAHKILDSVLVMLSEDTPVAEVRYMLERGRTYRSSGNVDKSRPFFLEAYQKSIERGLDYQAVDAAHMMVIIEKGEEALKWNDIAIRDAENSKDENTKGWLGSLYNNVGWTYFEMNNLEKSLELFEKNVKWHTDKKTVRGLQIAKWCVARVNRELGNLDKAYEMQLNLLNEIVTNKQEQDGYVYEELGEILLSQNKIEESKSYFSKAYELLSKDDWLMKNESARMERIKSLSK